MTTELLRNEAAVARRVVDGVGHVVLGVAAVAGVDALVRHVGASAGLGWVVAIAAAGHLVAALHGALDAEQRWHDVPAHGIWLTGLGLAGSLAVTGWGLFANLGAVGAALFLVGLRLTVVGDDAYPEDRPPA